MNARAAKKLPRLRILVVLFLFLVSASVLFYILGFKSEAAFAIQTLGAISVVLAVATALYGNVIRDFVQPLELRVEVPEVTNSGFDHWKYDGKTGRPPKAMFDVSDMVAIDTPYTVYCVHLRVRDARGERVVKDCRVWLTRVLHVGESGTTTEPIRFAVPRLMVWAPSEFSPDVRSFGGQQVFDFGIFFPTLGVFEVTGKQGGNFDCSFSHPGKRRFVFRIETEGFVSATEHTVEVSIEKCGTSADWPFEWRPNVCALS
jgi:hypothetical protein